MGAKVLIVLLSLVCEAASQCSEYPCLVFEDNFDTLNLDTWQPEITAWGGGNFEFQYYTNNRSNSYARDGVLYIKPTLTSDKFDEAFLSSGTLSLWGANPSDVCTGNEYDGCKLEGTEESYITPIQSARLRSVQAFNIRFGQIDVEAQMPKGDWIWPAIWMLPKTMTYGPWPASGEIDLVESRGNLDLTGPLGEVLGHDHAACTMHWGPFKPINRYDLTTGATVSDFADSFHTFSTVWDEEHIELFIDGQSMVNANPGDGGFWELGEFGESLPGIDNPWEYGTKMTPFDQEFFILLNVAVGGTNGYFSDDSINAGYDKPWSNQSPTAQRDFWDARDLWYPTWNPDVNNGEDAAMKVRSIRAWKLADN